VCEFSFQEGGGVHTALPSALTKDEEGNGSRNRSVPFAGRGGLPLPAADGRGAEAGRLLEEESLSLSCELALTSDEVSTVSVSNNLESCLCDTQPHRAHHTGTHNMAKQGHAKNQHTGTNAKAGSSSAAATTTIAHARIK